MEQDDVVLDLTESRYHRVELITWWRQARLRSARVLVVGAGALGNEVIKNLALLGIGQLMIIDRDTIELTNLPRAVLFREEHIGQPKAAVAAEGARALNADTLVTALRGDVTKDIGLGVFRRADVVVACLDNRAARRAVNQACHQVGRPWVDGGIDALDGMVRVFSPATAESACYECTLTPEDYRFLYESYNCPPRARPHEARVPTTTTAAAIAGALQTQEAIKLLHGFAVASGVVTLFSGLSLQMRQMAYIRRPDCPVHYTFPAIVALPLRAGSHTVADLFDALTRVAGDALEIQLPHVLLATLSCRNCAQKQDIYRRYHDVPREEYLCPACGRERIPLIVDTLPLGSLTRSSFGDVPLARLAIPPLAILGVTTSTGTIYVELSGDAELIPSRPPARSPIGTHVEKETEEHGITDD